MGHYTGSIPLCKQKAITRLFLYFKKRDMLMHMWLNNSIFYQIYPLGFCNAPAENGWDYSNTWNQQCAPVNRIKKVIDWIPHLKKLGVTAVYFSPVFQSDKHGYDTRDYYTIDSRLGSNDDFAAVCDALHREQIRVVLDGVFNHVGRGFWAFRDVQKNRQQSPYKDWFFIDWNKNNCFNDGFDYTDWEGAHDLVKLNLQNQQVRAHLIGAVEKWVDLFKIDGLRLDVAYMVDRSFLEELRENSVDIPVQSRCGDFALIGEIISGDYRSLIGNAQDGKPLLHSCTDYELYKGMYSSLNDKNFFEFDCSANRLFADNGISQGKPLMNFLDNHDVARIASVIKDNADIPLAYAMLFTLPGYPCVYYGSEWGARGEKKNGDSEIRPSFDKPEWNDLTTFISRLAALRLSEPEIQNAPYKTAYLANGQIVFSRGSILVALNCLAQDVTIPQTGGPLYGRLIDSQTLHASYKDLLSGEQFSVNGTMTLRKKSVMLLKRM